MVTHNLLSLREGSTAKVGTLGAAGLTRRRLLDLGFTPGAKVQCLFSAPSGSPRAYMIRGTVIALRSSDAENVSITEVEA